MRPITYLVSRYPAASHTFILNEIRALRSRGLDIRVVSVNSPDNSYRLSADEENEVRDTYYIKEHGVKGAISSLVWMITRRPRAAWKGLRAMAQCFRQPRPGVMRLTAYLVEAVMIGRHMVQQNSQHLHVHFGNAASTVGLLTAGMFDLKLSHTIHGPDVFFDRRYYFLSEKIERSLFVLCISEFCRSQLLLQCSAGERDKLRVVRLGVDSDALSTLQRQGRSDGGTRVVSVGRAVQAKGFYDLLAAVAWISEQGREIHLVHVGDGPELLQLKKEARRLGIGDIVSFEGALGHGETLQHVRDADVFVLPSYAEGLPVALMEAMAMGVCCVSTFIAGIPELIVNDHNGLLVPPGDRVALRAALLEVIDTPSRRQVLGTNAVQTVTEKYQIHKNIDGIVKAFSEMENV